jgi:xanthine dehydrogenase YagR molybdenum-binding subunit
MKFDQPATKNVIDEGKVIGKPVDRVDGPLKTTGTAPYAYDRHDVALNPAYGYILPAGIAKGRIASMDLAAAKAAPGVIAIVTSATAGKLGKGNFNKARLLGGPEIQHYHQAIALVVAETWEQARAAAHLIRVSYAPAKGKYDLESVKDTGKPADSFGAAGESKVGDFDGAFAAADVKLDATYHTAHESHAMMEPHASIAAWDGEVLNLWTANQMINWTAGDVAKTLGIPVKNVRVMSPYVGGGFGAKLWMRADALLAALGARAARRPVKVALDRHIVANNTVHRSSTLQRIRIGTGRDGKITAIAHESWSADLPGGSPEAAAVQTRSLYAGANRMTANRLVALDLPEHNAMRAPNEAPGLAALEIAIDEIAEKLGMDPVDFRIVNDTQFVPDVAPPKPPSADPQSKVPQPPAGPKPFTQRQLVECLRQGARRFGWEKRNAKPAQVRDGRWLVGYGVAAAIRDNLQMKSAARVRLDRSGIVTVETDMTDIGTGSYTVIAQTAAETLDVPLERVRVRMGDSTFPVSCGSGGQWGGNSSTSGVYAACMKLREMMAARNMDLAQAAAAGGLVAEDAIEFGDFIKKKHQATFGAHFVEVGVDAYTGEVRVRRMLAVCAAGRILNPKTARSQVIGGMTMGVGAALMEELAVDKARGFFVNHDLAGYEVPVHADIPQQEVVFLDEVDPDSSPMKAKGVGELGICGAAAAVANAVYNATGVRVREYPITLDKLIAGLPRMA